MALHRVAALWNKPKPDGKRTVSGNFKIAAPIIVSPNARIVLVPNEEKTADNQPTHFLLMDDGTDAPPRPAMGNTPDGEDDFA